MSSDTETESNILTGMISVAAPRLMSGVFLSDEMMRHSAVTESGGKVSDYLSDSRSCCR